MILLGTIVVPSNGEATNANTSIPFAIPSKYAYVLIVTPSVAQGFTVIVDTGNPIADANEFNVGFLTSTQFKTPPGGTGATIVSIFCSGAGGSCRVYGLYGLAQS